MDWRPCQEVYPATTRQEQVDILRYDNLKSIEIS